jgi:FkbM family methyltransferase
MTSSAKSSKVSSEHSAITREFNALVSENPADAERRVAEILHFDKNISIVLYGAGSLGRSVLKRLRKTGIEPAAFVDDTAEKQHQEIDGLIVLTPSEAALRFANVLFVVTILNPALNFLEAKKRLQLQTNAPVVSFLTMAWKCANEFLPYLQFELPQSLLTKVPEIRRGFHLWSDDESRRQFVGHLRFRLFLNYESLPRNSGDDYFPPELVPRLPGNTVFIDCGAYDGDTLRHFLQHQQEKFQSIYAFEPDVRNYERLRSFVGSLGPAGERVHTFNAGVGARRERLRFDAAGNMGSSFSSAGASEVEVLPLDEVVAVDGAPVFLKFDVEGAEWEALEGCQRLLKQSRPLIAISIYHRPDDLWALPLHLDSLDLGYRFFLRTQGEDGMDVICYAIPEH